MIITLLINLLLLIFVSIFSFLPVVSVCTIPSIGPSICSAMTLMVEYWNSFMQTFPYAVIVWQIFLFVILPFEALLLGAKFLLGSRLPTSDR